MEYVAILLGILALKMLGKKPPPVKVMLTRSTVATYTNTLNRDIETTNEQHDIIENVQYIRFSDNVKYI